MSKPRTSGGASRRLTKARERVDRWRRGGGGQGKRMPEELWREAVEVAREEGLYATARALRVDYCRLKERLSATKMASGGAGQAPAFVELELGEPHDGGTAVVELSDRAGGRMRIEVAAGAVDVADLVRTFRGRTS